MMSVFFYITGVFISHTAIPGWYRLAFAQAISSFDAGKNSMIAMSFVLVPSEPLGEPLESLERWSSNVNDDGLGNSDDRNNGESEEIHWPFSGESGGPPDDNSDSDEGEDRAVRLMADGSLFSDIVYTEFNHKLNLERFQENCIVQGKLRVLDLIDRVIDRHGIVQGNHQNVALFFMDRIHGRSDAPVINIGLVSGARVKVLCPVDLSWPSTQDTPLAERIRYEMSMVRKECGEYTKAAALKQESVLSLYATAKQAVNNVLHSLGELYPDGDLMTCWKEEMIDQAHSVRRFVDKAFYEHMDVADSGSSSKAAGDDGELDRGWHDAARTAHDTSMDILGDTLEEFKEIR
ncbi:hypothetical protein QBC37DRAFT_431219 [Rhypophila decipiens]|uniref:Uncharacterized protein n=1 Tax=Rhypophila decipiens TaxID=261697 RepID=A0AAN7B5I7_9PEZI|nr:hypothetical protein QBC37DRAFT_431219 [Rhypophila decipiens]